MIPVIKFANKFVSAPRPPRMKNAPCEPDLACAVPDLATPHLFIAQFVLGAAEDAPYVWKGGRSVDPGLYFNSNPRLSEARDASYPRVGDLQPPRTAALTVLH